MKTFFKYLSIAAILFAAAMAGTTPAKADDSYSFPAGVSFSHVVGAVLEPNIIGFASATLDSINFGFEAKYVRICLRTNSADTYFRFGTTLTASTGAFNTSLVGNGMILYAGSSTLFIDGDGASTDFSAIPMTAPTSTAGNATGASAGVCTTQPWVTRGVVMHIASGMATADVWGYR